MFELVLRPVIAAVRSWVDRKVYEAAQQGAAEGMHRFAAQLAAAAELPLAQPDRPLAITMPAAARTTAEDDEAPCPAENVGLFERLKELIANGMSQREAARQLGIPESTARSWLKRANVS